MSPSARWQGHQRRIGLTGGIATGKSSVGRYLAAQGIPVLDADRFAHDALAPGSEGETAVLQRYGARVSTRNECSEQNPKDANRINRRALSSIVFNEPDERQWLEELVHPYVRTCFDEALVQLRDEPIVVLMVPLLFEANLTALCSEIWVVHCRPEQQMQRLRQRNGLDEVAARARISAQWPLDRKKALADHLLDNSANAEHWKKQIKHLL